MPVSSGWFTRVARRDRPASRTTEPFSPVDAPATGAYQAQYIFPAVGSYLVTAETRPGIATEAPDVPVLSVTTSVDVVAGAHGGRRDWTMPMAVAGGVGMIAIMVIMLAGS